MLMIMQRWVEKENGISNHKMAIGVVRRMAEPKNHLAFNVSVLHCITIPYT